jgi:hypothetical protein
MLYARSVLTTLDNDPQAAADLGLVELDKATRAIADARRDLLADPMFKACGREAAMPLVTRVCRALRQGIPAAGPERNTFADIVGELPYDIALVATYRMERYFPWRGRPICGADFHECVTPEVEVRQAPFKELDRLERKLEFRRERVKWSAERTREEIDNLLRRIDYMRARPKRPDSEPMPEVLTDPAIPDWVREMWTLASRYAHWWETRWIRDALTYQAMRHRGVPESERLRMFPPRPKLKKIYR